MRYFKPATVVVAFVLSISVSACAASPASDSVAEESPSETQQSDAAEATSEPVEDESSGIEVDEGIFNVEVTIPKDFFEGLTEEEISSSAEEEGYENATVNPDGSVTYLIPKDVWEEGLAEMKAGVDETIQEIVNESPDVFRSVTYDNSLKNFDVTVNKVAYDESFEAAFVGFTLGFSGMFYQMFAAVPEDEQGVVINFIDESTGEVFETQDWPYEE